MNLYCTKCFTTILLEGPIAPTGSKVTCAGCGSAFTIYPSKTVIGDFVKYVMDNSDISARACSMIRNYVRDVDAPFSSLSQWILENSWYSERNRDVFMCRMRMLGEPGMTYDNIGRRFRGL